jgi:hypothetical protein
LGMQIGVYFDYTFPSWSLGRPARERGEKLPRFLYSGSRHPRRGSSAFAVPLGMTNF